MAVTPDTNLRLLRLPIELSSTNQLNFASSGSQYNYFNSLEKISVNNFTYQRRDNIIRYPAHIDSIINYNYVMYQNQHYTNKWYYAYVTDMIYVNDNMTMIEIKTDVYQTWQFDIQFMDSFVEREHVANDAIGLHTVPENLETGEYISTDLQPTYANTNLETCFCVAVSDLLISSYRTLNEAIPSGLYYVGFTDMSHVRDFIKYYDEQAKADAVSSVFVIPKAFFSSFSSVTIPLKSGSVNANISTTVRFSLDPLSIEITKPNYIGKQYTPKNNKLHCYPFNFLQVSNNNGSVVNYQWENFNFIEPDTKYKFNLRGVLTPGGSFTAYPVDYKNIFNNFDEAITLPKFPIGGWVSDVYTNWLTSNCVNIGLGVAGTVANTIGHATTGDIAGASVSGAFGIAEQVAQVYQHSLIPDQARGNTNVGDYSFAYDLDCLYFKRITIKNEYAKIIDDYFSMYGYKVNSVKVPNLTGRANWNYVKTINANIHGYIPESELNEIKQMFDSGLTIWHNPATFLDYSQNNAII